MSIGIPIKLLHEAEGHIVTLETVTGEVYRGKLLEAEDNMNCQMQSITVTARDGRVTNVEQVFIRGSMIRFFILPDMLKNAPMFKVKTGIRGAGTKPMIRPPGRFLKNGREMMLLLQCYIVHIIKRDSSVISKLLRGVCFVYVGVHLLENIL